MEKQQTHRSQSIGCICCLVAKLRPALLWPYEYSPLGSASLRHQGSPQSTSWSHYCCGKGSGNKPIPLGKWQEEFCTVSYDNSIKSFNKKKKKKKEREREFQQCRRLKSRNTTLSTKGCLVKAMVFPVVMYRCESWTIKKVVLLFQLLSCVQLLWPYGL